MKINDKKELHAKTVDELQKHLKEGNEILQQLKLDNVQNKLKNTRSIFNTRKDIAIIKSLITMKLTTKEGEKAADK